MPDNRLNIVIAGCGNIGLTAAERLLKGKNPCDLLLLDLHFNEEMMKSIGSFQINPKSIMTYREADATDIDSVSQAVEAQKWDRIDLLLVTVGKLSPFNPSDEFEKYRKDYYINFVGNVAPVKACLNLIKKSENSRIILISSTSGNKAPNYLNAYAPSKWALENFAGALRGEMALEHVFVDVIRPTNIKNRYSEVFNIKKGLDPNVIADRIVKLAGKKAANKNYPGKNYFVPPHYRIIRIIERLFPFLFDYRAKLKPYPKRKSMYRKFRVEHVVITGASSGLGKELAILYGESAGQLSLTGRNMKALKDVQDTITSKGNSQVDIYQLEMADFDAIREFASGLENVDMLVNNAGYYINGKVEETGVDKYYNIHDANYFGSVLLTAELLKKKTLKKVINISSTSAIAGRKMHSAYSSTKSAFWVYTRSLRRVFGNSMQVLEVLPSTFRSELFNRDGKSSSKQRGPGAGEIAVQVMKYESKGKEKLIVPFKARLYYLLEATAYPVFRKLFL